MKTDFELKELLKQKLRGEMRKDNPFINNKVLEKYINEVINDNWRCKAALEAMKELNNKK